MNLLVWIIFRAINLCKFNLKCSLLKSNTASRVDASVGLLNFWEAMVIWITNYFFFLQNEIKIILCFQLKLTSSIGLSVSRFKIFGLKQRQPFQLNRKSIEIHKNVIPKLVCLSVTHSLLHRNKMATSKLVLQLKVCLVQ